MLSAHFKNGFTLIELLIVIAIISILSVIGMSAYATVQSSARDSSRRTLIAQLAKSIEATKDPGTNTYKYADTDYTNDFGRSASGAIYADPSGYPSTARYSYCIKTSTSGSLTWSPTPDTTWTSTACMTGSATLQTSLATTGCASGSVCYGDVKSWVLCARLERSTTPYCVNSSQ